MKTIEPWSRCTTARPRRTLRSGRHVRREAEIVKVTD
jgi:hypothetical protein